MQDAALPQRMDLARFRAQFPITQHRTYLIHGAIAPAAKPVRQALLEWTERSANDPLSNFEHWPAEAESLRSRFARLIGADPRSVAITDGTSRGAELAVQLLAARASGSVIVDPTTYPSSIRAWRKRVAGELVESPRELAGEQLGTLAGGRLAAVVISHVAWQTGYRHDLAELADAAHSVGGILMVDAAQSAGAVPIDVQRDGVDVLTTTAMKWLLGVPGVGFLYIAPRLLADLTLDHARELEPGVPALASIAATNAALQLLDEAGIAELHRHIESLAGRCLEGLVELGLPPSTPLEPQRRAGVIALPHARSPSLAAHLRRLAIDVMAGSTWGFMRVDPAGFSTATEVDHFLAGVREWLSQQRTQHTQESSSAPA